MKNISFIFLSCVILIFTGCKKQDSIYEDFLVPNGLSYPGKAVNAIAKPGNERIEIQWQRGYDPKVVMSRIYWNNYTDSTEILIPAGADTITKLIDPIAENTYSFMIKSFDAKGNISIPVEVIGTVYGELYQRTLVNRKLKSRVYDGEDLTLEWVGADNSEQGLYLTYTDSNDGKEHTIFVDKEETVTIIPNFDANSPLLCQTLFKPDSMAIDNFQTQKVNIIIDPVIFLAKNTWKEFTLPDDTPPINASFPLPMIWNGTAAGNGFHVSDPGQAFPIVFTFDLGVKAELTSLKMWIRQGRPISYNEDNWARGHPREFEVYGSLDPNPDGSFDESWKLLGHFLAVKPSPGMTILQSDVDFATQDNQGIPFEFIKTDIADPEVPIRYVRFKILSNFGMNSEQYVSEVGRLWIGEISLWGKRVK